MFFSRQAADNGGFAKILLHASIKTIRSNYLGDSRYTTLYLERRGVFPLGITWCSTDWGLHLSYPPWSCASFTFGSLLGCLAPFCCWGGSHISFDKQESHRYVVSSKNSHPRKCPITSMVHFAPLKSPSFCSPWGVRPTRDWGVKPLFPPLSTHVLLYLLVPLILVLRTPQGSRAVASTE